MRLAYRRLLCLIGKVVPIKRDIKRSDRRLDILNSPDILLQPIGKRDAARLDSDKAKSLRPMVLFHDLMGDAHERPLHIVRIHQPRFSIHVASSFHKTMSFAGLVPQKKGFLP